MPETPATIRGQVSAGMSKEDKAKNEIQAANLEGRQIEELRAHGIAIAKATVATGLLWLNLCKFIRANAIAPKLVSEQLGSLGFNRVRVSEVNRVANAPDDVWSEYEAKAIGFRNALDLVRNGKPTELVGILADGSLGREAIAAEAESASGESEGDSGTGSEAPGKDQESRDAEALNKAAKTVLVKSAALGKRSFKLETDLYLLTVKRKKVSKPSKDDAGKE